MHSPPGLGGPILLVESDRELGNAIAEQLAADGFSVELAHTVAHARILAGQRAPVLGLIGSLESPDSSLGLLQEIRAPHVERACWNPRLPAMILADGATGELDVLRAFDAGADDFLDRSAGYLQLRARLLAVLRRCVPPRNNGALLEVGALTVDLRARSALVEARPLELRRMEFELLAHMAAEPARVFAREELLRTVWGYRSGSSTRTLESHASRLRRKLDPARPQRWIVNVWGVGYRLVR
jgi:DNA-binding response OmpR family regulator